MKIIIAPTQPIDIFWRAYPEGHPEFHGFGSSPEEALGSLMRDHAALFHLSIVQMEFDEQRDLPPPFEQAPSHVDV